MNADMGSTRNAPLRRALGAVGLLLCAAAIASCASSQSVVKTNVFQFLYPAGAEATSPGDVTLRLPARVGVAFVPAASAMQSHPIDEAQRQQLLEKIAETFRKKSFIGSLQVIPSSYLEPAGSFVNLEQIRTAFGVDLMTLVSYEQTQFSASTGRSIAYWTIVGAYIVNGQKNDTSTMLEAAIYDIPSRALLFRASGSSLSSNRATPVEEERQRIAAARSGFEAATDDLIARLDSALSEFEVQARSGTVRGMGTPAIAMFNESGTLITGPGSSGGAGALGLADFALLGSLGVLGWLETRRRRRLG